MSRLATRAEVEKLGRTLGVPPGDLTFLLPLPAAEIRGLREALYEHLFGLDAVLFHRLAGLVRRLPARIVGFLAHRVFGAVVTARIAGEIPARRAVAIARLLPATFLADVCGHVDPRRAPDFLRLVPVGRVVDIALELARRRDYLTIGRLVDFLPDETIHAVDQAIEDDEVILRVAFYVESRNRLDHLVRLMPRERVRRAILLVLDESRNVLPEVASLLFSVSYGLKRELGDLAAEQDETVLDRVVRFADEQDLLADVLPALAVTSESSRRRVVNLPILRRDPAVVERVLLAADAHDLWSVALPLVAFMEEPMRETVAGVAARLPRSAMEKAATAALLGEHWDALLDVVARMPLAKQTELAEIVDGYEVVDPDLAARVRRNAESRGLRGFVTRSASP